MKKLALSVVLFLCLCVPAFSAGGPVPTQVDSPTITGAYTSPIVANTQFLGWIVCVTVTGPVSGTLNLKMQTYDPFDNVYDIPGAAFPAITAPGTYTMLFWPNTTPNPGYVVNRPADQIFLMSGSVSGIAPSFPCQIGFIGINAP